MNKSLELPEAVYMDLVRAAQASGTTPANWIEERLRTNGPTANAVDVSDADLAAADAALDGCVVALPKPLGADNEQIDRDLARVYGEDHANVYDTIRSG